MKLSVWGFLFFGFLSFLCGPGFTQAAENSEQFSFKLTQGYRNESLDWNIAGGGVNVLSELTWDSLHLVETTAELTYINDTWARVPILIDLDLGAGYAVGGDGQDSDFSGNNRTQEFSRSTSSARGSHTLDIRAGFGPVFSPSPKIRLIPKIGYYYHRTGINLKDGVQLISESPSMVPLGPFPGLDSKYNASWHGPWVGALCAIDLENRWALNMEGIAYLADYFASARWNLRSDLANPGFEQDATGAGLRLSAELEKSIRLSNAIGKARDASVALGAVFDHGGTGTGRDTVFFANGSSVTSKRLNEVNWQSFSVYVAFKLDL